MPPHRSAVVAADPHRLTCSIGLEARLAVVPAYAEQHDRCVQRPTVPGKEAQPPDDLLGIGRTGLREPTTPNGLPDGHPPRRTAAEGTGSGTIRSDRCAWYRTRA